MKKLLKNPAVLIIIFITIPFLIIGSLHLVNFLGVKFGIDLNPSGIDNAGWFAFLGSFLGGICTLIAVLLTLSDNKKALEHSQRQTIYQVEREHLLAEKKLLSEVISNMQPFIVIVFNEKYQNILTQHNYDITKASQIITEIQNFSIKLQTNFERQRIESSIMNKCDKFCDIKTTCTISQISKYYAHLYWHLYNEIIALLNKQLQLISNGNNIANMIEKANKLHKSDFSLKFNVDMENLSKEINDFNSTFPSKSAKLVWLIGEFINEKQKMIMNDFRDINKRKCITSKWIGEKRDEMFEKIKKDIDDLLEKDKDKYTPINMSFDK